MRYSHVTLLDYLSYLVVSAIWMFFFLIAMFVFIGIMDSREIKQDAKHPGKQIAVIRWTDKIAIIFGIVFLVATMALLLYSIKYFLLFSVAVIALFTCYAFVKKIREKISARQTDKEWRKEAEQYYGPAEQGDAESQYELGWRYVGGYGVAHDPALGASWIRKAAEQGLAKAQCYLGSLYLNGNGVAKNHTQAIAWYHKAIEQGDADACCNLAAMYEHGDGVAQDYAQAMSWYRKAAERGDGYAQFNLGQMYGLGLGVAQDAAQARYWLGKAAQSRKDAPAKVEEYTGQGIMEKEDPLWFFRFRKVNERGSATFWDDEGNEPQADTDTDTDTDTGFSAPSATEPKDADAQSWLLKAGQQDAAAEFWLRKAAEQGAGKYPGDLDNAKGP